MRALVTGGAGFIGSHLVDALARAGESVRVLDRVVAGARSTPSGFPAGIEVVEADIRDAALVREATREIDVVFHLAAEASVPRSVSDPVTCYDVNVAGTLNVLVAARDAGCRRVVFASSSAVYGDDPALPKRETMTPRPTSPYASSKLAGEDLCAVFRRAYGLETVALRFFNVYGPRQDPNGPYAAVIPRFIDAVRAGESPVLYGDGEQTRDFVHVDDVARALALAATTPGLPGGPYNVASGDSITLNQLVAVLGTVFGRAVPIRHEPERPGDIRHSAADVSAIRDALGFEPTITLEEGLARTVAAS